MKTKNIVFIGLLLLNVSSSLYAKEIVETFHEAPYQVCFTPGGNCTTQIVDSINSARLSLYIQAYSFTSAPIAKAVVDAKKRGVKVTVILDKSQSRKNKYSSATYLLNNDVDTYIDNKPAIAHNKVMIIDESKVITGSFNYTKAAQMHNAENLLIINDKTLAKIYLSNWYGRQSQSLLARDYQSKRSQAHLSKGLVDIFRN